MDRKYYTAEQILDALSKVGVGAGDISEVMSYLGRMSLNNNSTEVNRENDKLNLQSNLQPTCNQLATEIIRCKDCKHRFLQDKIWQCPFAIPAFDNHFCAYAERKEDE